MEDAFIGLIEAPRQHDAQQDRSPQWRGRSRSPRCENDARRIRSPRRCGDAPARADAQGIPADRARPEQHRDRVPDADLPAAAVRLRRVAGCPSTSRWRWWSNSPSADTADFTAAFEQSQYFVPVVLCQHPRGGTGHDGRARQRHRGAAPGLRQARCARPTARLSSSSSTAWTRTRRASSPATCRARGAAGWQHTAQQRGRGTARYRCRWSNACGSTANCAAATSWCPGWSRSS